MYYQAVYEQRLCWHFLAIQERRIYRFRKIRDLSESCLVEPSDLVGEDERCLTWRVEIGARDPLEPLGGKYDFQEILLIQNRKKFFSKE